MGVIEASIENVNCIEVEVLDSQTEVEVSVNLVPEIEVQAFDYPPEIEALTQRVASTEELSLSANEVAVESKEIAANAEALAESAANTIDNHRNTSDIHNGIIAEYTVSEDAVQIDFNVNIPPDKPFTIYISSPAGYEGTSIVLRINDISTTNYQALAAAYSYFVVYANSSYFNGMLDMILIRGNVIIGGSYARASTVPAYTAGVYAECTFGLSLTNITKLSFIRSVSALIKAGTKILIKYK